LAKLFSYHAARFNPVMGYHHLDHRNFHMSNQTYIVAFINGTLWAATFGSQGSKDFRKGTHWVVTASSRVNAIKRMEKQLDIMYRSTFIKCPTCGGQTIKHPVKPVLTYDESTRTVSKPREGNAPRT
jgi:hypothetical protein